MNAERFVALLMGFGVQVVVQMAQKKAQTDKQWKIYFYLVVSYFTRGLGTQQECVDCAHGTTKMLKK